MSPGGGVGYVLVRAPAPDAAGLASALTVPATAGELWMVGCLLVRGVRDRAAGLAVPVGAGRGRSGPAGRSGLGQSR